MKNPRGKFTMYNIMKEDPYLVPHLPNTDQLTEKALSRYLDKYGIVIVKPCRGAKGKGVVQVRCVDDGRVEIQSGRSKLELESREAAYAHLKEHHIIERKKYIVQERIDLSTVEGNPVDVRVVVQRRMRFFRWEVTGILVKVSADGYFVTNHATAVMHLEDALRASSAAFLDPVVVQKGLSAIARRTARKLQAPYPQLRCIGLDIGFTNKGELFIIEANLDPDLEMFKPLQDKSMYNKIMKFKKGWRCSLLHKLTVFLKKIIKR
ncbi:YheC/YheD family protein [Rossellomorea aquimaris]|uniref:YheC/YheD family protein n=1 Tax=Rossellomorea aquimaris TaxID=189382 RepID=UPI001CD581F1|nr:YheC/YheD family protein [Rossellomorea aquimaris]MCA1055703.1 YheC/YheD family protein [Rossellomorea aquimaris]